MLRFFRLARWIVQVQMGINALKIIGVIRELPHFIRDVFLFRKAYQGGVELLPCLTDRHEEGGTARGEYFWQDLYVARKIFRADPQRHIDIGSRVDGFVAHVASYRQIEVFDIRPIAAKVPGVIFRQADLTRLDSEFVECCDSLSCLHALEHFGLGRYGDPLDPNGHVSGLSNMANLLSTGGVFYLSVPIGRARVQFNAHRVFDPFALIKIAEQNKLSLESFAFIDHSDVLNESIAPEHNFKSLSECNYALGIFVFRKG